MIWSDSTIGDLIKYFKSVINNYDQFSLGLSGGFDSRLLLALMLKCNIKPIIHTNGDSASGDVKIARDICNKFDIEFENYRMLILLLKIKNL